LRKLPRNLVKDAYNIRKEQSLRKEPREKTMDGGLFMALVSIYTVGRLNHPYDHPASREFFQVGNEVYRQATKSGLIEAFSP
jgi:hypothetical protein